MSFCRVLNESQNKYIDFSFIKKQPYNLFHPFLNQIKQGVEMFLLNK